MVTVITDPIEGYINNKFPFLNKQVPKTGGHRAVRESLLNGLDELGIPYIYNPYRFSQLTSKVLVLAGHNTLQQIVEYKRKNRKKFELAAGPNIVVSPEEHGAFQGYPEVNNCIVPSNWVKEFYVARMQVLKNKMIVWPAGINPEKWKPAEGMVGNKNIVFYLKRPIYAHIAKYKTIAESFGYQVEILDYGKYSLEEYRNILKQTSILVHFVEQESQGISLLEAWSMNIPTFVWNPGYFHYNGSNYASSSSPYLTENTGCFFNDFAAFEKLFHKEFSFQPRMWVLQNATEKIAALDLLNKLNWL